MAIDLGVVTAPRTRTDRTWRIEFFVADDDKIQIRFHRELRANDEATGELIVQDRNAIPVVIRTSDQIAAKSYTVGPMTATGQQILQMLNKMSDVERQVDIDAVGNSP